jgi:protein-S-isoprenylcysteine O-methyltransferase Ste14
MSRIGIFVYGVSSYLVFFAVFLHGIGFIGGFLTPTRDLVSAIGTTYVDYRARTPMLIPRLWSRSAKVQRRTV